jgi:hypothetical protein
VRPLTRPGRPQRTDGGSPPRDWEAVGTWGYPPHRPVPGSSPAIGSLPPPTKLAKQGVSCKAAGARPLRLTLALRAFSSLGGRRRTVEELPWRHEAGQFRGDQHRNPDAGVAGCLPTTLQALEMQISVYLEVRERLEAVIEEPRLKKALKAGGTFTSYPPPCWAQESRRADVPREHRPFSLHSSQAASVTTGGTQRPPHHPSSAWPDCPAPRKARRPEAESRRQPSQWRGTSPPRSCS